MEGTRKKLSDAELEVMLAVWEMEKPATGGAILERIRVDRGWALSTLMTVLSRLEDKGYLACDRSTRSNLYSALVEESDYKEQEGKTFLRRLYGNSLPGFVSCLYRSGAVSESDLEELRGFLDRACGKEKD